MRNLNLYRYVFASSSVYTELNFDFGWLMVVSVSPRLPWHPSNFCRPTTRIFPEKVRKHSNEKLAPGSLHFYYFRRGTRSNQSKIQTLSHHTHGLWSTSSRIWALSPWHPYLLLWSRFNQWTRLLAEQKKNSIASFCESRLPRTYLDFVNYMSSSHVRSSSSKGCKQCLNSERWDPIQRTPNLWSASSPEAASHCLRLPSWPGEIYWACADQILDWRQ